MATHGVGGDVRDEQRDGDSEGDDCARRPPRLVRPRSTAHRATVTPSRLSCVKILSEPGCRSKWMNPSAIVCRVERCAAHEHGNRLMTDLLWEPIEVGAMHLQHRLAMALMTRDRSAQSTSTAGRHALDRADCAPSMEAFT